MVTLKFSKVDPLNRVKKVMVSSNRASNDSSVGVPSMGRVVIVGRPSDIVGGIIDGVVGGIIDGIVGGMIDGMTGGAIDGMAGCTVCGMVGCMVGCMVVLSSLFVDTFTTASTYTATAMAIIASTTAMHANRRRFENESGVILSSRGLFASAFLARCSADSGDMSRVETLALRMR